MHSMVLLEEFQFEGTVQEVPEVRKMVFGAPPLGGEAGAVNATENEVLESVEIFPAVSLHLT
jgi:hypothetical protein